MVEKSNSVLTSEGLKNVDMEKFLKINEKMAADGLRVLGIAMRKWDSLPKVMSPEHVG